MSKVNYNVRLRKTSWKTIKIAVTRTLKQLLMIDLLRYIVGYMRRLWYLKLLRRLKIHNSISEDINKHTIAHNTKGGLRGVAVIRSNQLLRPLSVLDPLYQRLEDVKILSIGPRTEGEILNIIAHGFCGKNIKALDLVSYSPWISVGDMHAMPYKEDSFDLVINGWVISYSNNIKKAAQEMVRVVRPGGIIAIGLSYNPPKFIEKAQEKRGYSFKELLLSVQDILELFGDAVDHVYLNQELLDKNRSQNLIAIFSVKKSKNSEKIEATLES